LRAQIGVRRKDAMKLHETGSSVAARTAARTGSGTNRVRHEPGPARPGTGTNRGTNRGTRTGTGTFLGRQDTNRDRHISRQAHFSARTGTRHEPGQAHRHEPGRHEPGQAHFWTRHEPGQAHFWTSDPGTNRDSTNRDRHISGLEHTNRDRHISGLVTTVLAAHEPGQTHFWTSDHCLGDRESRWTERSGQALKSAQKGPRTGTGTFLD